VTAAGEGRVRADIVEVGRRLYARGLIGGNEGNVSVRAGDVLFVTPPGVCKGFLTADMVVRTDLRGRPLDGHASSTETRMHTAVYERRPDVGGVVHAHPPTATAFAAAGLALDQPLIAEAVVSLGVVPVVPYGTPSTEALAGGVAGAICDAQALLLANHGALTVGADVFRAWERMETLEHLARVTLLTRLIGRDAPLSAAEVDRLAALRAAAGYPPPVCAPGEVPAAADERPVVLTRAQLAALVVEAVERFGRA
jgi:L-fuculose-phosphate aldolase